MTKLVSLCLKSGLNLFYIRSPQHPGSHAWWSEVDWCNNNTNKCTINVTHLNQPQPSPIFPVHGKIFFRETSPWCQKGWGPLLCMVHSVGPNVKNMFREAVKSIHLSQPLTLCHYHQDCIILSKLTQPFVCSAWEQRLAHQERSTPSSQIPFLGGKGYRF